MHAAETGRRLVGDQVERGRRGLSGTGWEKRTPEDLESQYRLRRIKVCNACSNYFIAASGLAADSGLGNVALNDWLELKLPR